MSQENIIRWISFNVLVLVVLLYALSYPVSPGVALSYYTCPVIGVLCPELSIDAQLTDKQFQPVLDTFRDIFEVVDDRQAQMTVYHRGKMVLDVTGKNCYYNCQNDSYNRDTLQNVFSSTKVVTSIVIAHIVDQGILDYSAPIASYWPEFAQNGKHNITLGDVMRHESGLAFTDDRDPQTDDTLPLFSDISNSMEAVAEIIERSFPHFERPDETRTAYHGITRGLILNEVVRRTDPQHRTIGRYLQEELTSKWNVDFHIGLENNLEKKKVRHFPIAPHQTDSVAWRSRIVLEIITRFAFGDILEVIEPLDPMPHDIGRFIRQDMLSGNMLSCPLVRGGETIRGAKIFAMTELHNNDHARRVESPSSNGMSNAHSMAAIMNEILLMKYQENPLISNRTRSALFSYHEDAAYDIGIHAYVHYTDAGWAYFHERFYAFEGFYGWAGMGGSFMVLDPEAELAVAFTTTRMELLSPWADSRSQRLLSAVRRSLNQSYE